MKPVLRFLSGGSGVRLRPFLIAAVLGLIELAGAPAGGAALAGEPVRLAQRWTPLTGVLTPEGESGRPEAAPPRETSSTETPKLPKTAATAGGELKALTLKVTLVRTVTDGQPHGSLGVQTISVDADLARGLGLDTARGVLVTDAEKAGADGLLAGDIIEQLDDRAIGGADALLTALKDTLPDRQATVDVRRAGTGAEDLKRLLIERADAGNVGAAASLGRLFSLGLAIGPRDFGAAARYYLKAAEAGHLASMTRYALFAKDGVGVPRDETLAATWFRKAADGGQDAAMTNLGTLYETGRGVRKDLAEAARWYQKAVDKGHVFAMHRLALMYEAGRGVAKDDQEAVRLLRAASDRGLSEATSWLADKYEQGRGIPKDTDEAFRLNARAADQVRRAAEQGNAVATFNLGILYRIGKGVKKSDSEAAYWVVKSLRLGDKYLVSELMRNPNVLSEADRKWLQEVLRDEGTYKGPINGTFTPEVRTAMEALASRA